MKVIREMNVIAHGIDVVEILRIQHAINSQGSEWLSSVYSEEERSLADAGPLGCRYFAGRYAGKEAVAKALGTGFSGDVTWRGIELLRFESGATCVRLTDGALERANELGIKTWLVSISYSSQLAFASVIATD